MKNFFVTQCGYTNVHVCKVVAFWRQDLAFWLLRCSFSSQLHVHCIWYTAVNFGKVELWKYVCAKKLRSDRFVNYNVIFMGGVSSCYIGEVQDISNFHRQRSFFFVEGLQNFPQGWMSHHVQNRLPCSVGRLLPTQYSHVTCHGHARLEELVKGSLGTDFVHGGTFTRGGDMHPWGKSWRCFKKLRPFTW